MGVVAIVNAVVGVFAVVIARLSAAGRLPRQGLVGIRIPSTMRSDETWVAGHRAAAPAMTVAGAGAVAFGILDLVINPSHGALPWVGLVWLLGWFAVATVIANRAARAVGDRS
jgi:hypothetical protein